MAYKRILTVQDISCVGQCSATVVLPVLSACGHEACLLPTALLSTHTGGFSKPAVKQLADFMPEICDHWLREGIRFDAVYTGYLGSVDAVRIVRETARKLMAPDGILIVDPAMADNGKLYSGFDENYVAQMRALCADADILLPNVTEAAMLSGLPLRDDMELPQLEELANALPGKCVVLTGAGRSEETGVLIREGNTVSCFGHPKVDGSYSGTGDLFAACFVGALMQEYSVTEAAQIAAEITYRTIRSTFANPAHSYGIKFETALPALMERLKI